LKEADALVQALIKNNPDYFYGWLYGARIKRALGNVADAARYYKRALDIAKDNEVFEPLVRKEMTSTQCPKRDPHRA
jgi:tetratricopeptide (TPR) repeat protein